MKYFRSPFWKNICERLLLLFLELALAKRKKDRSITKYFKRRGFQEERLKICPKRDFIFQSEDTPVLIIWCVQNSRKPPIQVLTQLRTEFFHKQTQKPNKIRPFVIFHLYLVQNHKLPTYFSYFSRTSLLYYFIFKL